MKDLPRLSQEDAEIARLFAATRTDAPDKALVERALARSKEMPTPPSPSAGPRMRRSGWFATALVGAAVVASLGAWTKVSSHPRTTEITTPAATQDDGTTAIPARADDKAIAVEALPSESPAPATITEASPRSTGVRPSIRRASIPKQEPARAASANLPVGAPPPPAGSARQSTFAEELALVKSARAALARGDIAPCIDDVEHYERTFADGAFAEEIAVIRIEALARSGARANARERAERFLNGHASSPYASRVRSVLQAVRDESVSESKE